jgi:methylmalonyl-CoA mutase N-terminal domain/subunit
VERALAALCRAAERDPSTPHSGMSAENTMPFILDCVRAYATVGEIAGALKKVMGEYREVGIL